jgi:hypothetical protein
VNLFKFGIRNLGAFPALRAGNRAFRCKSSDLLMQILWAFRFNAPEDGRFPIGMDCRGRYRAPGIPGARTAVRPVCYAQFNFTSGGNADPGIK